MVACRFIVIKVPFLSKSQNTFPGERGTLPKAGNHSPVKFLDLSSDFPGPHRATAARLTRTYPSRLPPGPNPSRDPRPNSTGTVPAYFHPAPAPPKGTRRPAHRNLPAPVPARPASLPRPVARLHRNHPGSIFTRPPAPHRGTTARLTGTHPPRLPPSPNPSRDPQPSATGTIPAHFLSSASPKAPPGSRFAFPPKGRPIRPNGTRGGEAESPPPREIMSIKGYKAVTFYHKSAAFARAGKEFPAYFRNPRSFWGDFGRFPGFFGLFPGDFGLFPSPPGRFGAVFFRERLTRKPDWAIIVADCFRGPGPDPLV